MTSTHRCSILKLSMMVIVLMLAPIPVIAEDTPAGPKSIGKTCGKCPEGYREVGSSSVPARCGNQDGGRLSQCQLERMELNLPDPTKGGKICPPDCGNTAAPGQGRLLPPPKHL